MILIKSYEKEQSDLKEKLEGRQYVHKHLVLSSVNFETGLKWHQSKKELQALKDLSDQLCRDYGLSVIEKGKGWKSYGENHANAKGGS